MGAVQSQLQKRNNMSRYPSAFGHTPSYRSLGATPVFPSALGSRDLNLETPTVRSGRLGRAVSSIGSDIDRELSSMTSNLRTGRSSSVLGSQFDKEISSLTSSLRTDPLLQYSSPLSTSTHSSSNSTYKSEQCSSASRSVGGRPPKHDSSFDSTYKSRTVGDSGIPHSGYAHQSRTYSSNKPYGNT